MDYVDYAARGQNAGWRYVLALLLACVLAIVVGAIATVAIQLGGWLPRDWIQVAQDPRQPISFFLFNGVIFGLLLLGLALSVVWVQRKRPADLLGLWSWRLFGLGAAVWLAALTLAGLIDFVIAPSGFRISASSGTLSLALVAVTGLAAQTFAEEYIFRGHITQGLLLAIRKPLPTALVSGMIFGAVHIPNGAPQAVSATVFGVLLALIAIRTRGIAFTFGLHLVNNVFAAVLLVSAGDVFRGTPGIISQDTPQLTWWDMGVGSVLLMLATLGIRWLPEAAIERQNSE